MNLRAEASLHGAPLCPTEKPNAHGATRVVVVNAERSLFELTREWLAACGFCVMEESVGGSASPQCYDLAVVDVPFPRQGGLDFLRRVAGSNPGTPIVALSSNFFPGIESSGELARTLGVERVLAMPVTQDALVMAVRQVLRLRS